MADTNKNIDRYLRRQLLRKVLIYGSVALIFIAFMTYALYVEYGPDAEIVDIINEPEY